MTDAAQTTDRIAQAAEHIRCRMEDQFMEAALSAASYTSSTAAPSEPLTLASIAKAIKALGPPPPPRAGQIVESVYMVDRHEDWSQVRSPSRTKRRMRYNAGRIYTYTPKKEALRMPDGSLVMHPAMAKLLREQLPPGPRHTGPMTDVPADGHHVGLNQSISPKSESQS